MMHIAALREVLVCCRDHFAVDPAWRGKDPNFALAYAGLADASLEMYGTTRDGLWAQKALGAAQQAQQLNDELADVHFSLGSVYKATGKVAESILELDRALQLAPNSDEGFRRLGGVYLVNGRKEEALKAFRKAIDLNLYYWANYNSLGTAYFQLGEYEKAFSAYRRVTELEPDNSTGYENIGDVYLRQGKYNDCVPVFKKALELSPRYDNYSYLGTTSSALAPASPPPRDVRKAARIEGERVFGFCGAVVLAVLQLGARWRWVAPLLG